MSDTSAYDATQRAAATWLQSVRFVGLRRSLARPSPRVPADAGPERGGTCSSKFGIGIEIGSIGESFDKDPDPDPDPDFDFDRARLCCTAGT